MIPCIPLLNAWQAAGSPHSSRAARPAPVALYPENPRYLLFRGKPTVLVTSGEHYGALLNRDFDYRTYLDTLRRDGLNLTRVFSGVYCEHPAAFRIRDNTLAPAPGRFLAPWARSGTAGYANGGAKFDLTWIDGEYVQRLKDLCAEAGRRGIVVELTLFCPFYEEEMWRLSPMNAANNVNGIGAVPREEVYTLKDPDLLAIQDALVRRLATELRDVDNLYYEICNEPYFGGVTLEWQHHIADTLSAAEAGLPHRHLIAQNIANGSAHVDRPHPAVSILNFHYASPPDAVAANYPLARPIAFDETGFKGTDDATYRAQAWEFLLAGGAVFDSLDYSFTVTHPDGTAPVRDPTPGGGSPALRRQLGVLKRFLDSLDFAHMQPDNALVESALPNGASMRGLSAPGRTYALYARGVAGQRLALRVPAGRWREQWLDPETGQLSDRSEADRAAGILTVDVPLHGTDAVLRLDRLPGPRH